MGKIDKFSIFKNKYNGLYFIKDITDTTVEFDEWYFDDKNNLCDGESKTASKDEFKTMISDEHVDSQIVEAIINQYVPDPALIDVGSVFHSKNNVYVYVYIERICEDYVDCTRHILMPDNTFASDTTIGVYDKITITSIIMDYEKASEITTKRIKNLHKIVNNNKCIVPDPHTVYTFNPDELSIGKPYYYIDAKNKKVYFILTAIDPAGKSIDVIDGSGTWYQIHAKKDTMIYQIEGVDYHEDC